MQRTQIYLPKQQLKDLQVTARRTETTVSAVIRMFLAEKLVTSRGRITQPISTTLVNTAKRINALGKPGPKNLAGSVDHYLYGK